MTILVSILPMRGASASKEESQLDGGMFDGLKGSWGWVAEGEVMAVESLCRNKGGTISRMRSTFSTNAGSQAVKQIRPPYGRGVSAIPRASSTRRARVYIHCVGCTPTKIPLPRG